jgi:ribonuclease-3
MFITQNDIENIVGTKINNIEIYQTAFTHRSALKQYSVKSSYETLEFLGDAVLSFVITKYLYDTYSEEHEGFMTKARTKIVRGKTLSQISESLGLDRLILMDDKGLRNQWNKNPKILEDVFEALIGAIYIDLGILHVKQFISKTILSQPIDLGDDNFKDIVMRWCQANKYPLPVYIVRGYAQLQFTIDMYICNQCVSFGVGSTKKQAEQDAAEKVVRMWNLSQYNAHKNEGDFGNGSVGSAEIPCVV